MKTTKIQIAQENGLYKYLKINQGTRKWNRELYACVSHDLLSSVLISWMRLPKRRFNPLWSELIEVDISDEKTLEMNYNDDQVAFSSAIPYCLQKAESQLQSISDVDDLFELILDKDWNWAFRYGVIQEKRRVLMGSVIFGLKNDLMIEEAISKSEHYFGKELDKKVEFLKYIDDRNITAFTDFKIK